MKLNAYCAGIFILVSIVFNQTIFAQEGTKSLIDRQSILNSLNLDYQTGNFSIDDLIIKSLPIPSSESESKFAYNPDDGGELHTILQNEKGEIIGSFDFYAEQIAKDQWEVKNYKLTQTVMGKKVTDRNYVNIKAGTYKLIFYANGREFYTYTFQVDLKQDKDPIFPEDIHTLEGDWDNLGYVKNTNQNFTWNTWVRDKNNNKELVSANVELSQGDKLIASSDNNAKFTLTPEWALFNFDLELLDNNIPLAIKDLTKNDGVYNLRLNVNGKTYGQWIIEVVNGQLKQKNLSLQNSNPKLTWYSKDKNNSND